MSKVQLTGNASGTGIFTIAAPNSNVDRTLTLPDNTGTLLSTASNLIGVAGVGKVLQVLTSKASGTTTSASTAPISIGIATNITVRAGSSVLALATTGIYGGSQSGSWSSTGRIYLYRNLTGIAISEHMGIVTQFTEQCYTHTIVFLDQNLSAGTYTYSVYGASTVGGTLQYNRDAPMGNLVLMEIAA